MKYTVIVLALLLAACKKDKEQENKISFTGIVYTDQNGAVISNEDPTDWGFNDTWTKQETNLFTQRNTSGCTASVQQKIQVFPNPCKGFLRLFFTKANDTKVAFRLVDKNFKTLIANDTIIAPAIVLDIASLNIKDTVRLYYKFIENNCECRGHGDVVVE